MRCNLASSVPSSRRILASMSFFVPDKRWCMCLGVLY